FANSLPGETGSGPAKREWHFILGAREHCMDKITFVSYPHYQSRNETVETCVRSVGEGSQPIGDDSIGWDLDTKEIREPRVALICNQECPRHERCLLDKASRT